MRSKTGGHKEFTTKSTKDTKNGIRFKLQHPVESGLRLDCGYRVDLLVEDNLIISGGVINRTGYYTPQA